MQSRSLFAAVVFCFAFVVHVSIVAVGKLPIGTSTHGMLEAVTLEVLVLTFLSVVSCFRVVRYLSATRQEARAAGLLFVLFVAAFSALWAAEALYLVDKEIALVPWWLIALIAGFGVVRPVESRRRHMVVYVVTMMGSLAAGALFHTSFRAQHGNIPSALYAWSIGLKVVLFFLLPLSAVIATFLVGWQSWARSRGG